ncbi:MAG: signal peptidase II, partial [bacterium]
DHWLIFWLGLLIVGALGNLTDRLLYGAVIDIIEIPGWSILNLADLMVVAGIIGWLVKNIWLKEKDRYSQSIVK